MSDLPDHPPHAIANAKHIGGLGDIVFERPGSEFLRREDYEALVRDLEQAGYSVSELQSFEQKGGLGEAVIQVAFRILDDVEREALHNAVALLIGYLLAHLRKPRTPGAPRRIGTIYGPRMEKLATVELDEENDDTAHTT